MKITCKNCKKSFEGERYYGICPFCGTYHDMNDATETGASSVQNNPYTEDVFSGNGAFGGAAYQTAPGARQQQMQQQVQEPPRNAGAYSKAMQQEDMKQGYERQMRQMEACQRVARERNNYSKAQESGKKSKAPMILVAVNVVMIAMTVLYMNVAKYTTTTSVVGVKNYTESTFEATDTIKIGKADMEITGVRTLDLSAYGNYLPAGKKMIAVNYELTTEETSFYADVNEIYIYDPVDDVYRRSIDSYRFIDFMQGTTGVNKNDITNSISYVSHYSGDEGCFLFLLNEDVSEAEIFLDRTAPEGKREEGYHSKYDELFYLYDRIHIHVDIAD